MTAKELKKLSRTDLLEMMLSLSRENAELREKLSVALAELERRSIAIQESGTLAEAALKLNGVFTSSQAACEEYERNIRQSCEKMEQETRERCEAMLAEANERLRKLSGAFYQLPGQMDPDGIEIG